MDKATLRQDMSRILTSMTPEDKAQENKIIFELREKNLFHKYNNWAIYISLSSEADTRSIIDHIQRSGNKCLLPIQQGDNFFFTEITTQTQYKKNIYGFLEPIEQEPSTYIPDAILVPGLGFTTQGARLGRGLGRYDKLLAQYPDMTKIGVSYATQIIKNIPTQAHDQHMDIIVSTKLYFTS